ncbi:extensin family protein [Jiella sp. M17.18]|uniref:extensin family protein n=1 Tax=Jiella sp. M17.18 TaxID=3234247 RepID=UPI0034DDF4C7
MRSAFLTGAIVLAGLQLAPGSGGEAAAASLLERIFPGIGHARAASRHHRRAVHHVRHATPKKAATAAASAPEDPPVPTPRSAAVPEEAKNPPKGDRQADERAPVPRSKPGEESPSKNSGEAAAGETHAGASPQNARHEGGSPKAEQNGAEASSAAAKPSAASGAATPDTAVAEPSTKAEATAVEAGPVKDGLPAIGPIPETRPDHGKYPEDTAKPRDGSPPTHGEDTVTSPKSLKAAETPITPALAVEAAAAIEDAKACEAELTKRGVTFTVGPSISEGSCGVLRPVAIRTLSSGIAVEPATTILCRTALALDEWASDVVVPAAKGSFPDAHVESIRQEGTYVCRPRSSEDKISEHARGSAIDIGTIRLSDGRDIGIVGRDDDSPEARFQHAVRAGACGPFRTVLGPGTDSDHATHFHLDIDARRNGATYCK